MSASTLINSFAFDVTLTRFASGSYSNGIFVTGATTTSTIKMSIQPINGKELLNRPEAQRTKRIMKGYTDTQLYTAELSPSKQADRITDTDGSIYEVQKVENWTSFASDIAPHWKVELAEVNP